MKYRTLCRNPDCLHPLHGYAPVKLHCNAICREAAYQFGKNATRAQSIEFEERFIQTWAEHYETPCFGIETEMGA